MLPAAQRLRRPQHFGAVIRAGRRAGTRLLVIHLLPAGPPCSATTGAPRSARAGFVVSGKVGNSVVRHRITRRLRPVVRDRLADLPPGTDVVIRALGPAAGASSAELTVALDAGLRAAARKAGIVLAIADGSGSAQPAGQPT